jgi:hypothetical protein
MRAPNVACLLGVLAWSVSTQAGGMRGDDARPLEAGCDDINQRMRRQGWTWKVGKACSRRVMVEEIALACPIYVVCIPTCR